MLYAAALGLGLVMALLAVPVHLAFNVRRLERTEGSATVLWLFGLVRIPVPVKGKPKDAETGGRLNKQPESPGRSKRKSGGRGFRKFLIVIRNGPFRRRVFRLIGDLAGAVKASGLQFHAVAGLDDPADTGMLWGAAYPLLAALNLPYSGAVSVRPDFTEETFQFAGSGSVRVIPLQVFFIVVFFILSPTTLRMIWILRPWKR